MQAVSEEKFGADWWGVVCSVGCAIHCAATPILLSLLPSVSSFRFLADPLFHQIVAGICCLLVARAIIPGLRVHKDWRVGSLAASGIGLLVIAAFILPDSCCDYHGETDSATTRHRTQQSISIQRIGWNAVKETDAGVKQESAHDHSHQHDHGHAHSHDLAEGTGLENCCAEESTWGKTLFSLEELKEVLGEAYALKIASLQPYLSPLGGCFLVLAHLLNIRLRCCSKSECAKG